MSSLLRLCFVSLFLLAGCTGRVDLFTASTDAEANDMLSALLHAGVRAQKAAGKNGAAISVRESDVAEALEVLRRSGLPRERYEGMGKIFHKEGMISSPLEERARYVYALSQELENTLTKVDGVLVARVHVVLPEQDIGKTDRTVSSAAVFIKHQPGYDLELLRPQIRTLVAHAIPDLSENRVSVILVGAQRNAAAGADVPASYVAGLSSVDGTGAVEVEAYRLGLPWPVLLAIGAAILAGAGTVVAVRLRRRRQVGELRSRDGFGHNDADSALES